LYLVPTLLGWQYHGLAFDVALHWGTLAALLLAFWRDWFGLIRDAFSRLTEVRARAHTTWLKLAAGSVPAATVGFFLRDAIEIHLRALPLQAVMLATFGFLLWWVDRVAPARPSDAEPGWRAVSIVGLAQAFALVPGVSRSGVTITAGRAVGMPKVAAARFSFLLATPITFGAGLLELRHLRDNVSTEALVVGIAVSALVGLLAIRGLLAWLGRAGFGAFFAYRAALAIVLVIAAARP
jgi:undecaprenyl-diphosphatase